MKPKPKFNFRDKVSVRSGTYSTWIGDLVYHRGLTTIFHRGTIEKAVIFDESADEWIYSVQLRGKAVYIRESYMRKVLI